ncbi:MAG: helix-turn-helix domain-containing protein [Candidatus Aegiribacteria sp.]|nr:helix-turn-helix domain-containing protein [Candidatus Aegiribacteria sp.]
MSHDPDIRASAICDYFDTNLSIRDIADKYGIPRSTVGRWIKQYQCEGIESLESSVGSLAESSSALENRVIELRETNPWMSIEDASLKCTEDGFDRSIRTVHNIWSNHGRGGEALSRPPLGCISTGEGSSALAACKVLFTLHENEALEKAASILNSVPSIPPESEDIMRRIPPDLLSPRRQLDKIALGVLDDTTAISKAEELAERFSREGLILSRLLAEVLLLIHLHHISEPEREISLGKKLINALAEIRLPFIRFYVSAITAISHAKMLDFKTSRDVFNRVKQYTRKSSNEYVLVTTGDYYSTHFKYDIAKRYFKKALKLVQENSGKYIAIRMRLCLCDLVTGEHEYDNLQTNVDLESYPVTLKMINLSILYFRNLHIGDLAATSEALRELMILAQKTRQRYFYYLSVYGSAAIHYARGRREDGDALLRRHLPFMRKMHLGTETAMTQFALGILPDQEIISKHPLMKLLAKLHKADKTRNIMEFRKAREYAMARNLMGFFVRHLIMKPDLIDFLVRNDEPTGLPSTYTDMPAFSKKTHSVKVSSFGQITACIDSTENIELDPEPGELLMYLAMKIPSPGRLIQISSILGDFVQNDSRSKESVLKTLRSIRRFLPSNSTILDTEDGISVLHNNCLHFETDIDDLFTSLGQVRTLLALGGYKQAESEFMAVIDYSQGLPLDGCESIWSEDMRDYVASDIRRTASMLEKYVDYQPKTHKE